MPSPSLAQTFDINHPENAPAKTPADYLDVLTWHSALHQYELALETSVTINHTALATKTTRIGASGYVGGGGTVEVGVDLIGDIRVTEVPLVSHSVSDNPIVMVALNGRMLPSGFIVQISGEGIRQVAPWVSSSEVGIRETAVSGSAALPAISLTYRVMIFRSRAPDPVKPMFAGGPSSMQMARGIIDGSRKYAKQVAVGESPFSINLGPTLDDANGRIRSATGGIVVSEPGYSGSLAAPAYRNIGL